MVIRVCKAYEQEWWSSLKWWRTDRHSPIPLINSAHPAGWDEWKQNWVKVIFNILSLSFPCHPVLESALNLFWTFITVFVPAGEWAWHLWLTLWLVEATSYFFFLQTSFVGIHFWKSLDQLVLLGRKRKANIIFLPRCCLAPCYESNHNHRSRFILSQRCFSSSCQPRKVIYPISTSPIFIEYKGIKCNSLHSDCFDY